MSVFRHHMLRSHELHSLVLAEAAWTVGVLCPIAASSVKGEMSGCKFVGTFITPFCVLPTQA